MPDSKHFATVNKNGRGSAVVFRDSFASGMYPYLSETFARVAYYWAYPTSDDFYKIIELEKPDVVIEERVERMFQAVPEPVPLGQVPNGQGRHQDAHGHRP